MRYPYERFLRFLVSRKIPDLSQVLRDYGLPRIGDLFPLDCRTSLLVSSPPSVRTYLENDSEQEVVRKAGFLEWAESIGIRTLWEIQPEFRNEPAPNHLNVAFQVFANSLTRATLGMLLLADIPGNDIETIIRERFNIALDDSSLDTFQNIFWDTNQMERKDWDLFVPLLRTKEERHLTAIGLSSPDLQEIKELLGLGISVSPEAALEEIMAQSLAKFRIAMEQPDPMGHDATRWADLVIKAAGSLRTKGADSSEDMTSAELGKMFSVRVTKSKHVSLTDLKGHFSAPQKEKKEVE